MFKCSNFQFGAFYLEIFKFQIFKFAMFNLDIFNLIIFNLEMFNLENLQFSTFQFSSFQISEFQKSNVEKLGRQTFQHFQKFRFSDMRNSSFKDVRIIFLYHFKYFGDKYKARGSRFGHNFGRSKNHCSKKNYNRSGIIN